MFNKPTSVLCSQQCTKPVSKILTGENLKVVGADLQLKVRWFCFIAAYVHVIHAATFRVENLVTDIYEFLRRLRLRPEAGLLNKSSCLAPTLGVTEYIIATVMIWVTLCCAT
jgi:hypothetical protein